MSKKNPGNRQLNTGSDQDGLTAEEQALEASMQADDGAGEGDDVGGADQTGDGKTAAPAKQGLDGTKTGTEGDGEGADESGKGQDGSKGKPLPPEALAAVRIEREEKKTLREALKAAEEARKASDERFSTLEKRTNLILEKLVPKEEPPKPEVIPDFEADPAGWIAATMKATGKTLEDIQKELAAGKAEKAQHTEQQKQTAAVQGVISKAAAAEREFITTTPDYNDAGAFFQQARVSQLEAIGYTPEEVQAVIQQEKFAIADKALKGGKNPAEIVYNLAKTMGYVKKAPANGSQGNGSGSGNGADAARDRLEAARDGRAQGSSLGDARGQGPSPLTAKRLLEMSEAEFAKAMETEEGRALMGR